MSHPFATDFATEAARGVAPVTVATTSLVGLVDWNVWVLILTALFLLLQIGWIVWKMIDRALGKYQPSDD